MKHNKCWGLYYLESIRIIQSEIKTNKQKNTRFQISGAFIYLSESLLENEV